MVVVVCEPPTFVLVCDELRSTQAYICTSRAITIAGTGRRNSPSPSGLVAVTGPVAATSCPSCDAEMEAGSTGVAVAARLPRSYTPSFQKSNAIAPTTRTGPSITPAIDCSNRVSRPVVVVVVIVVVVVLAVGLVVMAESLDGVARRTDAPAGARTVFRAPAVADYAAGLML